MRKRFRVLILAAIVAAVVVPVGFALSLESDAATTRVTRGEIVASTSANLPVIMTAETVTSTPFLPAVPDGAKLFVVGTVLFGLAAAVRRSV